MTKINLNGLLILTFFLIPLFGYCQSDSLKMNDSIYHQYCMKKDLVIITGYQIQRNHFGEIGIGIMKDGVVGHHPSTSIYGFMDCQTS